MHQEGGFLHLGRASYCEIYNEALYDLVRWNKQQLAVRWDTGWGFHVPDLLVRECATMADMLDVRPSQHC